jgi:hypothetical protein
VVQPLAAECVLDAIRQIGRDRATDLLTQHSLADVAWGCVQAIVGSSEDTERCLAGQIAEETA